MSNSSSCLEIDLASIEENFAGICKRKVSRFHFGLASFGFLTVAEKVHSVWLHDISEQGVGFGCPVPLTIDLEVLLKLTIRVDQCITLPARFKHSTPDAGEWRIGCEFTTALTPEMLEKLL